MDYFQGVVTDYLRADRATFVNVECLIQLEEGSAPAKGRHWYCDAVAVNFREQAVYLCEVTYSSSQASLLNRLRAWSLHWDHICSAIHRDCRVPADWTVQPWAFIPQERHELFQRKLALAVPSGATSMPNPRITYLESVTPWRYCTWDRREAFLEGDATEHAVDATDVPKSRSE